MRVGWGRRTLAYVGWLRVFLVGLAAASCRQAPFPPTDPDTPKTPPATISRPQAMAPSPTPLPSYRSAWEAGPPAEFADVSEEGWAYVWLYAGDWRVTRDDDAGPAYSVSPYRGVYPEPLTFRRYRGKAFGPNGVLPRRYLVEAEGRSTGGSPRFGGVGELAIQVVYLDPTHYLEVLQTNDQARVWWANGAQPQNEAGWTLLASKTRSYRVGEWLRLGAEVDLDAGTLVPRFDGERWEPIPIPEPLLAVTPRLTLRATGNGEQWRSLAIEEISAERRSSQTR